jgi:hypothetical protein
VKTGPDLTFNGYQDAFVARLNPQGTDFDYCGYIGGDDADSGSDVIFDDAGNLYVMGRTESTESTFPVKTGPDLTFNGGLDDAYIARVNAQGTALDFCGYIGGSENDRGSSIALDGKGNVFIVGTTHSAESTFPVKGGPDLTYNGEGDAYVARLDGQSASIDYCGYVGGIDLERGHGLAVDEEGNAYLSGDTYSDEHSFPTLVGPSLRFNGGDCDGFVTKIGYPTLYPDSHTLPETGGTIVFLLEASSANADRSYLLLGGVTGTDPGYPLPGGLAILPLNLDDFTYHVVIPLLNTPTFSNFLGTLDAFGQAEAELSAPALPPGYVGQKIYFAYCLNVPFDFASNPVEIEIVP